MVLINGKVTATPIDLMIQMGRFHRILFFLGAKWNFQNHFLLKGIGCNAIPVITSFEEVG